MDGSNMRNSFIQLLSHLHKIFHLETIFKINCLRVAVSEQNFEYIYGEWKQCTKTSCNFQHSESILLLIKCFLHRTTATSSCPWKCSVVIRLFVRVCWFLCRSSFSVLFLRFFNTFQVWLLN